MADGTVSRLHECGIRVGKSLNAGVLSPAPLAARLGVERERERERERELDMPCKPLGSGQMELRGRAGCLIDINIRLLPPSLAYLFPRHTNIIHSFPIAPAEAPPVVCVYITV